MSQTSGLSENKVHCKKYGCCSRTGDVCSEPVIDLSAAGVSDPLLNLIDSYRLRAKGAAQALFELCG